MLEAAVAELCCAVERVSAARVQARRELAAATDPADRLASHELVLALGHALDHLGRVLELTTDQLPEARVEELDQLLDQLDTEPAVGTWRDLVTRWRQGLIR